MSESRTSTLSMQSSKALLLNEWNDLLSDPKHVNWNEIKALVLLGVDPNIPNQAGQTAIHSAAMCDNWQMVEFLVDNGADINTKDEFGTTVLLHAALVKNWAMVKWLAQHAADLNVCSDDAAGFPRLPLLEVLAANEFELAAWLVTYGADINRVIENGHTILHIMAINGLTNRVEWLLQHGADSEIKNELDKTALEMATLEYEYPEIDEKRKPNLNKVIECFEYYQIIKSARLTKHATYKDICQRLSVLSTPIICDALPSVRLLDPAIAPVGTNDHCIGRAYTVNSAQDSLSTMQALDDMQAFLALLNCAETDIVPTILVIAACGAPYAIAGGMCANVAKLQGFAGIVTDGPCRDIVEIKASQLPFFAKGKCAKSGNKQQIGTTKDTIQCGDVTVNLGDIIFADGDGVVALSKTEAISAIVKGEKMLLKETEALQKIRNGARFNQICNIDDHVRNLEANVPSKLRMTL